MTTRILVADDSPTVLALVERAFRSLDWEVVTVADGIAALEVGRTAKPDLAFLDYFMPGLLGVEVIQAWAAEGLDIPTIMLSSLEDGDAIVGILESGAVDFIAKPFNVREVVARARIHLHRTRV